MKKIVLIFVGLLFLIGCGSAYSVTIDAPETLSVGKPLFVNGTTTIGVGIPVEVVLYSQATTSTEVKRKVAYIQSDKTFRVFFDTTDLQKGMYKVEVLLNGMDDSVTMRLVTLVNRSDEIVLLSSTTQNYDGNLSVAGMIKDDENSGVRIEVIDSDGISIFGPEYVNTNYLGGFTAEVPIPSGGDYDVTFADAKGYIGTWHFTVVQKIPVTTTSTVAMTTHAVLSDHAPASRDEPAYFIVRPGYGTVNVHTVSTIDLVIEYADDHGVLHTVNDKGERTPEMIQLQGKGKPIYLKLYPYKYSDKGVAILYAENINSISVSPTVPAVFAPKVTTTTAETQQTQKSPVMPVLGFVALILLVVWRR